MADEEPAGVGGKDSNEGRPGSANERAAKIIKEANIEVTERCQTALALPIAVLTEQRDELARELETLRDTAAAERKALVDDQDAFIADLMAEHEKELASLRHELGVARERITRQEALMVGKTGTTSPGMPAVAPQEAAPDAALDAVLDVVRQVASDEPRLPPEELEAKIHNLQAQLEQSFREIDEARGEASRYQDQLDQAKSDANVVRDQMFEQIEASRDEVSALQRNLAEANRMIEDTREQSRDEAFRLNELIAELRRELDERREEVRRVRTRLAELDREGMRQSVPPPGPDEFARELDNAHTEARTLRKQLIDAKRELSKKTRELEESRSVARRPGPGVRLRSDASLAGVFGDSGSVRPSEPVRPSQPTSVRPSEPPPAQPSQPASPLPSEPAAARPSQPTPMGPSEPPPVRPSQPTSVHPSEPPAARPSPPTSTGPSEPKPAS